MPDEQTQQPAESAGTEASAATQNTPATQATPTQSATSSQEEPFDRDRAMTTIRSLREQEKVWKADRKRLQDIEAKAAADEQKRLTEAGEWKTLAEQHEARVRELEPLKERNDKLLATVQKRLDRERKSLPKHITALLDKLSPEEQLDWLDENAEAIAKPTAPNVNARDGLGGKPPEDPNALREEAKRFFRL